MADETWVAIGGQWVPVSNAAVADHGELDYRDAPDSHPLTSITGLDAALAGKAEAIHTHTYSKITVSSLTPASPNVGDIWIVP